MSRARDLADRVLHNRTHEDTEGGRESIVTFKGEQSGGEISTLAQIQASHDGTSDDQKADLIFKTNDGSDNAAPTTAMVIDSAQNVGINATPKATHADADVVRFGGTGYIANWEDAEVYLSENMYQDTSGAYKYLTASHASLYSQTAGKHQFRVAGSGSADAAITFNTALEIDNDGIVTKPLQPAFQAHPASQINNIGVGTNIEPSFDNERFDQNGDYDGTNTFTAPVTGKYQFNCLMYVLGIDSASDYYELMIATSNKTYYVPVDPGGFVGDLTYYNLTASVLADMDANDTCLIRFRHQSGTQQTDISAASNFSGYLVC